jgi:Zn-dependent protease/CBS domain-containing protein
MVRGVKSPTLLSDRSSMAGTVPAFRLFGVPVRLHFTFLLLLVFLIVTDLGSKEGGGAFALFVLGLFASVLLHELSHAWMAGAFKVRTIEIVMFPIGGVSRMERALGPKEELWVALAGPAMNLLLAGIIFGVLALTNGSASMKLADVVELSDANVLPRLAFGNLLLAGFNLIPAFPMDGGRILRALLSFIRTEEEATRMAAWMGRMLAISMALYGLYDHHFMLVFGAFFVYLGAAQEGAAALGRTLTHGIPVRAAMIKEFHTLSPGDTVRHAADLLLATSQQDFPVVHGTQVAGLLSRNLLVRAMASEGPDAYVAGVMDREYPSIEPGMDLSEVLPLMAQAGQCALVMDGEQLLGMLTTDNLSEFLLLRRVGLEPVV